MKKRVCAMLTATAMLVSTMAGGMVVSADEGIKWPEKTVNIIVPSGAGGDTDFNARLIAEKLTEKTGGTFIVTNINGNNGATGSLEALSADADGYTILFHHTAFAINNLTGMSEYTYDDTEFIGVVGRGAGNVITMSSEYGINSIEDLIAYTEEHPGELKISAAAGATTHATALRLRALGADVKLVDAGGATDRISALLGGHVDIIINSIGTIADYLTTGELVGLATDSDQVSEGLRDEYGILPASEEGYDLGLPFYYSMMFPKGTDQAIVDELNVLLDDIINNDTDYQERIYDAYMQEPCFIGGEEGLAAVQETYDALAELDFNS